MLKLALLALLAMSLKLSISSAKKPYGKADQSLSVRALQCDVFEPWFAMRGSRDVYALTSAIRRNVIFFYRFAYIYIYS